MSKKIFQQIPLKAFNFGNSELTCSAASAGDNKASRFEMTLYTGGAFRDHWYWGNIYLDLEGLETSRQDLPARENHLYDTAAGFTDKIYIENGEVKATGYLLQGSEELIARKIERRLTQDPPFPYQTSGTWMPKAEEGAIEQILANATAKVNGETITGPATIFRKYDLHEVSFCERGWDNMTSAKKLAASENDTVSLSVSQIQTEAKMPKPDAPKGILASLRDVFGADRAIELVSAHPDAQTLSDFAEDMTALIASQGQKITELGEELTTAKSDLAAHTAELATANELLAEAKKNPAVLLAGGDAPEGGKKVLTGKALWTQQFETSADLQEEFGSVDLYIVHKSQEDE